MKLFTAVLALAIGISSTTFASSLPFVNNGKMKVTQSYKFNGDVYAQVSQKTEYYAQLKNVETGDVSDPETFTVVQKASSGYLTIETDETSPPSMQIAVVLPLIGGGGEVAIFADRVATGKLNLDAKELTRVTQDIAKPNLKVRYTGAVCGASDDKNTVDCEFNIEAQLLCGDHLDCSI